MKILALQVLKTQVLICGFLLYTNQNFWKYLKMRKMIIESFVLNLFIDTLKPYLALQMSSSFMAPNTFKKFNHTSFFRPLQVIKSYRKN